MVENTIPNGWVKVKFSDYIIFQEGPGLMSFLFKETGFPFVNIRCIENGNINKETCQYISNEVANGVYKHFQLEEDDLIVSTSGTLGKKAFVKKTDLPLLLNTSIIRFKPKNTDNISLYFLNYLLEDYSFLYDLYSQSTGSAQVNVGPSHLKKLFIKIPKSITEQQAIANILTKTDQAISNTEALIAKYTHIKTGLMQDLLTKGIDENGNIRSEQTHVFKESPLGRIPKEWECDVLRSYVSYISYGFTNPMPESLEGPYLITAANINKGRILYETSRKTTYKAYKELLTQKSRPIINDVLITKDGSIGRLAIVDSENLCINQSVAIMRVRNEKVDPTYFKMLLESNKYQDLIMADSGGSTIKHIYITKIDKMFLAIPTNSNEQTRILSILKSQDEIIEITQNQLSKLQSLKTGLMQDLLTGKVRVKI